MARILPSNVAKHQLKDDTSFYTGVSTLIMEKFASVFHRLARDCSTPSPSRPPSAPWADHPYLYTMIIPSDPSMTFPAQLGLYGDWPLSHRIETSSLKDTSAVCVSSTAQCHFDPNQFTVILYSWRVCAWDPRTRQCTSKAAKDPWHISPIPFLPRPITQPGSHTSRNQGRMLAARPTLC